MIELSQIEEILLLYKKYGWTLRRVLLTDSLKAEISDNLEKLFGETALISSETDAIWLSRNSIVGNETWELRHLSAVPFALVEVFDENEDEKVREERLYELESELKERTGKKSPEKFH